MEYDRYQVNRKLFILGIICLILSIVLLLFSAYILPFLVWQLAYDVPEFIVHWLYWFQDELRWPYNIGAWIIFLVFFVPGLIAGIISYYSSNKIDDEIYHMKPEKQETLPYKPRTRQWKSFSFGFKLLFLVVMVFILAEIVHWLIYIEPGTVTSP